MIFSFIVLLIPFIILAAAVAMLVALMKEDKEDFEKKVRAIYLYVIEFTMLILVIMGTIGTIVNVTDFILPTQNYNHTIVAEQNTRNRNIKDAITNVAIVGVALPTFLVHKNKVEELKDA